MAEFIAENWAALLWFLAAVALLAVELATVQLVRSEERRVGKECM